RATRPRRRRLVATPDSWYYRAGGRQLGPVSFDQFGECAASGQITGNDEVWQLGTPDWVAVRSVTGLAARLPPRDRPQPAARVPPLWPEPQAHRFTLLPAHRRRRWLPITVGVAVLALVGAVVLWCFVLQPRSRPSIAKLGGTVLVYEVDVRQQGK